MSFSEKIQEDIALAPLTTIHLGGAARYFVECKTIEDITAALVVAKERGLPIHILGGGSNSIFADEGFNGLVLAIRLRGITFFDDGVVEIASGEGWDDFVQQAIARGLAGLECLSGIPGLVGATPMQNVGAYGQDVAEVIDSVTALDRTSSQEVVFSNEDCRFEYRSSRFKVQDAHRYIITSVRFQLRLDGVPTVRYPQVAAAMPPAIGSGKEALLQVREAVINLRKSKSMVLDASDPNTHSCGSFFVNPIISKEHLARLQSSYPDIPFFTGEETPHLTSSSTWTEHSVKIPAAWLVEKAGFQKGMRQGGVGVSTNHPLALININGTTSVLLAFAASIQAAVQEKFDIALVQEPIVIPPTLAVE